MALTKVKGSGLATGAATASLVGIDDNATSTAITIDASERTHFGTATNRLGEKVHVLGPGIVTSSAENTNIAMFGTFGGNEQLIGSFNDIPVVFRQGNVERMRILSGGGLTFNGDTAAANALDDYETGTATLTLTASTTAPTVAVTATAYYAKIGNTVTVSCTFANKDITGAVGNVLITGFPFTTASSIHLGHLLNSRGQNVEGVGYMSAANTTMTHSNYAGVALPWGTIGPNVYAFLTVTYRTA